MCAQLWPVQHATRGNNDSGWIVGKPSLTGLVRGARHSPIPRLVLTELPLP